MIFVDSNVPMYLLGREHPNKHRATLALERLASANVRLVTSAEVIQEILHRYVAINLREAIQPTLDALYRIADTVFDITEKDVVAAKRLVLAYDGLPARDAVHIAVMQAHGVARVLTFDKHFRSMPGIEVVPT